MRNRLATLIPILVTSLSLACAERYEFQFVTADTTQPPTDSVGGDGTLGDSIGSDGITDEDLPPLSDAAEVADAPDVHDVPDVPDIPDLFDVTDSSDIADVADIDPSDADGACIPDCTGKVCGSDGCGGTCEPGCGEKYACNEDGQCAFDCVGQCQELECTPESLANKGCDCGNDCEDENPCTDDSCDTDGMCVHDPNGEPCDDANPCTTEDRCGDGVCAGTTMSYTELMEAGLDDVCGCENDDDCLPLEDGDVCNGTLICDGTDEVPICAIDPGTILTGTCDDGIPCTDDSCHPVEGCVNAPDDTLCDDANVCTDNVCDPDQGCIFPTNGATCDDGDPCTGEDMCDDGVCVGSTPIDCDDGIDCTEDWCEAGIGCQHEGVDTACDDSNPCTNDFCQVGIGCQTVNNFAACDDSNPCTQGDHCDGGSCVSGVPLQCDDGDPCNGQETCTQTSGCESGIPLDCDDGNPCTEDFCEQGFGCKHPPADIACDDGNACTEDDSCVNGVCMSGWAVVCDDGNPCTNDSCDPVVGCVTSNIPNGMPCPDSDPCNGEETCQNGTCTPAPSITCEQDGNPCTVHTCVPQQGCVAQNVSTKCTPDGICAVAGECVNGFCQTTAYDTQCFQDNDWDHDNLSNEKDPCPLAWEGYHADNNGIQGPDACEQLKLHGDFQHSSPIVLYQPSTFHSQWRRTHEPVEIPLANGYRDESLELRWSLDGGGLVDSSGHGHDGSYLPSQNAFSTTTGAFAEKSSAVAIVNSDGTINTNGFALPRNFTYMLWFNYNDVLETPLYLLSTMHPGGGGLEISYRLVNGMPVLRTAVFANTWLSTDVILDIEEKLWHHLAVTYEADGRTLAVYLDGEYVGGSSLALDPPEGSVGGLKSGFRLGRSLLTSSHPALLSTWDEIHFFRRTLSAFEIGACYQSGGEYGTPLLVGARADFDDVRVTEHPGTSEYGNEFVKRSRVVGVRPHSRTPCASDESQAVNQKLEDLCLVEAYWPFDGSGEDVTNNHPVNPMQDIYLPGRFGDVAGALRFSGNEYFDTGYKMIVEPGDSFTFEAWVLPDDTFSQEVGLGGVLSGVGTYIRFIMSAETVCMRILADNGPPERSVCNEAALQDGVWHHLAYVYDGTLKTGYIYVDGIEIAANYMPLTASVNKSISGGLYLGAYKDGQTTLGPRFRGRMDEVLVHTINKSPDYIYHRARPAIPAIRFLASTQAVNFASEKQSDRYMPRDYRLHWGSPDTPMMRPFVNLATNSRCYGLLNSCLGYRGFWRFDEMLSGLAVDSSTNKANAELSGTFVPPHPHPGRDGPALQFSSKQFGTVLGAFMAGALTVEADVFGQGPGSILCLGGTTEPGDPEYAWNLSTGSFQVGFGVANEESTAVSSNAFKMNQWTSLVGRRFIPSTALDIHHDLVNSGSVDKTAYPQITNVILGFAHQPHSSDANWAGILDTVRIMGRSLEPDEFLHHPLLKYQLLQLKPEIDGCQAQTQATCNGCACQSCVCAQDPFCCANTWDNLCAAQCEDCGGCN